MTRYRGGTYSHTVDKVVFTDGTSARTDLIRLNPNLQAYSLDFAGIAPHHPSPYRLGSWSALPHLHTRGCEAEVEWILRHSYPMRSIAQVSDQLRRAGYPLGRANISEHEAIAATQAAIWHFTNGMALDTRPLNAPVAVHRGPGSVLTFEFHGKPQLGGYALWTASESPVAVRLQKSTDGIDWHDVSGSRLVTNPGKGQHRRTLGVGSTLSSNSHGRGARGYRFYRLLTAAPDGSPHTGPAIDHVDFWLTGSGHYRNADRVVHLYNYLLSGAYTALRTAPQPLIDSAAVADSGLVGPFQVSVPMTLSAGGDHHIVDAFGALLDGTVRPGTDFYVRFTPGSLGTKGIRLTGSASHQLTGRVLTGVALADPARGSVAGLTPVALTTPVHATIEFDITWQTNRARTDIVGECG
ncbi:TQXA domain-containing protein [Mycobacterium kiyosense]|nr:TQXA domain-containing protein [Mycobacterium kiyosense]BDE14992.1 TQXA domain-containing protein [Mycobacterium sp. 20KCMC460]GLB83666.1 TQXA domain-containing protein [Mycobacterium kiyosense]GLB87746.1 TQXA domain-containing protein [Mycobacterium kiyosense]GLC03774.1 TQXA domain-containing protein [Mycobacterium kiyosense]